MSVLDQVTELKNQGMKDSRIINTLKGEGFSPKQINDALNQARIKNAVSSENNPDEEMEPSIMPAPKNPDATGDNSQNSSDTSNEDLNPPYANIPKAAKKTFGKMTKDASNQDQDDSDNVPYPGESPQSYYTPSSQEISNNYGMEQQQQQLQQPPAQDQQDQDYYPQQDYEYQPETTGSVDSDTMIEIAEQVFAEKSKSIQRSVDDLTEISTLVQSKIENFSDRLKRIESTIDKLQNAILDKIGTYGTNIDSIRKEMGMMQDSFGKIVNTALDHKERKHTTHENPTVQRVRKTTTVIHKSTAKKKSSKKK